MVNSPNPNNQHETNLVKSSGVHTCFVISANGFNNIKKNSGFHHAFAHCGLTNFSKYKKQNIVNSPGFSPGFHQVFTKFLISLKYTKNMVNSQSFHYVF